MNAFERGVVALCVIEGLISITRKLTRLVMVYRRGGGRVCLGCGARYLLPKDDDT